MKIGPVPLNVPCAGWLPIANVNGPVPLAVTVIGVAVSSTTFLLCAFGAAVTFSENAPVPAFAGSAVSIAIATKLNEPDCVGVPVNEPTGVSVTPAGSAPLVSAHPNGLKPPNAANDVAVWLIDVRARRAPGDDLDRLEHANRQRRRCGALRRIGQANGERGAAATCGVPVMVPLAFSVKPSGSDPATSAKLNGGVEPVCSICST